MNLMALTPDHTIEAAPMLLHTLITLALESLDDGRDVSDINMVLGVSGDIEQGRIGVRHVMSYLQLDAIICFGGTSESVGLERSQEVQELSLVRFRQQVLPVAVVCLPPVFSSVWRSTATVHAAAQAIKPLLTGAYAGDLVLPESTVSFERRDLN